MRRNVTQTESLKLNLDKYLISFLNRTHFRENTVSLYNSEGLQMSHVELLHDVVRISHVGSQVQSLFLSPPFSFWGIASSLIDLVGRFYLPRLEDTMVSVIIQEITDSSPV